MFIVGVTTLGRQIYLRDTLCPLNLQHFQDFVTVTKLHIVFLFQLLRSGVVRGPVLCTLFLRWELKWQFSVKDLT